MTLTEFETLTIESLNISYKPGIADFSTLSIETKDGSKYTFILPNNLLKQLKDSA